MRYLLLTLAISFFNIKANAQQAQPFHINGRLHSDNSTGKVFLFYPFESKWVKDSCQITNGLFSFDGKIAHPVPARLVYENKTKELFIEPTTLSIVNKDDDLQNAEVLSSPLHSNYEELNSNIKKINTRWKSVIDTLSAVNKRSNITFQELKGWVLNPYFEEIREVYLGFIKNNPNSYITAYLLASNIIEMNQGSMPTDSLKKYFDSFSDDIKKSAYGEMITKELAVRSIGIPGTQAIEFTKTNVQGRQLSLSQFRGKYVLLDFWGSWCVPCRKGNPHLKELYSRYKEKGFDIIGIAADNNTEDAWKKAIQHDALPWHHVLIGTLDTVYNITSYPTKILIDEQGIIIGRFGAEEKELDEKLNAIFN